MDLPHRRLTATTRCVWKDMIQACGWFGYDLIVSASKHEEQS
jgi:hypothetical protein